MGKKCPQGWGWVGRWYEMIAETVQILTEFICWFIALLKSLLSLKSDLVSQTNLKRLQFGPQKCLKLHVGRKCQTCPELPIDTWKLEKSSEEFTSMMDLVDIEGQKHIMEEVESAKYTLATSSSHMERINIIFRKEKTGDWEQ